jgi:N-acetylglucosaminyl-diphospho-decaprenol L-rhamnosyltransferase
LSLPEVISAVPPTEKNRALSQSSAPRALSAIIVCYRTAAELAAAIASLRAQREPPSEIIVIDNGAADGDPVPDGSQLKDVVVIRPSSNVGYGAACNLGVTSATGDELLLLNADVVLTADAIEKMRSRLARGLSAGVVGPRILAGESLQPSARAFPRLRTGLLGRRSPLTRLLARLGAPPAEFRRSYGPAGQVDWVSGACMLVRREAFEDIGGFDESYWLYWEDADLCRRLADCGWRIYHEPASVVHHATAASGINDRTIRAFHDSAMRFADQHIARNDLQKGLIRAALRLRCRVALALHARTGRLP